MQPVCTVRVPKITTTITVACVHPALTLARTAQLRELRLSGDEGSRACNAAERLRYLKRARLTKRFPSRTLLQWMTTSMHSEIRSTVTLCSLQASSLEGLGPEA